MLSHTMVIPKADSVHNYTLTHSVMLVFVLCCVLGCFTSYCYW